MSSTVYYFLAPTFITYTKEILVMFKNTFYVHTEIMMLICNTHD